MECRRHGPSWRSDKARCDSVGLPHSCHGLQREFGVPPRGGSLFYSAFGIASLLLPAYLVCAVAVLSPLICWFVFGVGFNTYAGGKAQKRRGLVVRAGKPALCLTKRNRPRKSLARAHGFRVRMRTATRGLF